MDRLFMVAVRSPHATGLRSGTASTILGLFVAAACVHGCVHSPAIPSAAIGRQPSAERCAQSIVNALGARSPCERVDIIDRALREGCPSEPYLPALVRSITESGGMNPATPGGLGDSCPAGLRANRILRGVIDDSDDSAVSDLSWRRTPKEVQRRWIDRLVNRTPSEPTKLPSPVGYRIVFKNGCHLALKEALGSESAAQAAEALWYARNSGCDLSSVLGLLVELVSHREECGLQVESSIVAHWPAGLVAHRILTECADGETGRTATNAQEHALSEIDAAWYRSPEDAASTWAWWYARHWSQPPSLRTGTTRRLRRRSRRDEPRADLATQPHLGSEAGG